MRSDVRFIYCKQRFSWYIFAKSINEANTFVALSDFSIHSHSMSDNATEMILKLVNLFLKNMATKLNIGDLEPVLSHFPSSLFKAKKDVGLDSNTSVCYVTCPSCFTIYDPTKCVVEEKVGSKTTKKSATCNHVRFPDHVQARMREECGAELMIRVCSVDGVIPNTSTRNRFTVSSRWRTLYKRWLVRKR